MVIRRRWWSVIAPLVVMLAMACSPAPGGADRSVPVRPLPTLFPTIAAPVTVIAERPAAGTWQSGGSGIELRHIEAGDPATGRTIPVVVVRIDPAQVRVRVGYDPAQPRLLRAWFLAEQPLLVVNAGFFTPSYESTALVVSDGVVSGTSYEGFGGMFSVAPDGAVTLRSLREQPYDPAEQAANAFQSFPMLINPGGAVAALEEDGQVARRTALAIDRSGRLLIIVCPTSAFSLRALADWLAGSDLEIDRAFNLDGGSSTGLLLRSGALEEQIDAFTPLPLVLLIDEKR
jgi:uncharacterized protein YigE (DUF2233 family)